MRLPGRELLAVSKMDARYAGPSCQVTSGLGHGCVRTLPSYAQTGSRGSKDRVQ